MTYVRWHENTSPKIAAERGIARELISNLIDAGFAVAINNGGDDWEVPPTLDKEELFDSLSQSDLDILVCFKTYKDDFEKIEVGWEQSSSVMLVYGNSPYELIADYNMNLESVIRPALDKQTAAEDRFA